MGDPTHQNPYPSRASSHPASLHDSHALAAALAPALRDACAGSLGPIDWFRAAWQHSGASTGFSTWTGPGAPATPVLVKFPVGPTELRWTSHIASTSEEPPTPRVLASGVELAGSDIAWLVIERFPGNALSQTLDAECVTDLLRAATDFHSAAAAHPIDVPAPPSPDWDALIARAREMTKHSGLPKGQHWNEVLKAVQRALPVLKSKWASRRISTWCHGDLHPGNAMRRASATSPEAVARHACVLIDLALVHPGHWVEDALYLERLYWGRSEQIASCKPVSLLAQIRRERNIPTDDNYAELAMVRRVLMAACVPCYIEREGHPKYTQAALEILERTLPQVSH